MPESASSPASPAVLPLLYHELRPGDSAYTYALSCSRFAQQLAFFAQIAATQPEWYRPLLTFDDGHRSNYEHALPLLQQHGAAAHFFITVGWMGNRADSMTWQQVRALHDAGQQVGAHGWSHALLTHCSAVELDRELRSARERLEDGLGTPVTSMSLPGGRANAAVMAACRAAGYTRVWNSAPGAESLPLGPVVGRFNVLSGMSDAWLASLLDSHSGVLRGVQRKHRLKSAGKQLLGDRMYARLWALLNRSEGGDSENAEPHEPALAMDGRKP